MDTKRCWLHMIFMGNDQSFGKSNLQQVGDEFDTRDLAVSILEMPSSLRPSRLTGA